MISLASDLTKRYEQLEEQFKLLNSFGLASGRYLEMYATFLRDIMHNEADSQKIKDKMGLVKKNHAIGFGIKEDVIDRIAENTNSLIATVSGNQKSFGMIVTIGDEIKQLLHYRPSEVIGKPVEILMPTFYSANHRGYMKRFIDTGVSHIIGKKKNVFALDSKGYIKSCSLYVKVLPDFSDGILFLGMLRHNEANSLINNDQN